MGISNPALILTAQFERLVIFELEKTMTCDPLNYKERYLLMTKQYSRDIEALHLALQDLHNSNHGLPKSCGHENTCTCPDTKAKELIELFGD